MVGLEPEPTFWSKHSTFMTFVVIILIAASFTGLRLLQQKYLPFGEPEETKNPVFLNHTFEEVDTFFNVNSNMTEEDQKAYFDDNYKYNVVKWSCRPLSCQEILGTPTLKLICKKRGFTEDVRIAMKEDCIGVESQAEVTVVFQLMSKTTGEYYLGRAGRIVE